MRFRSPTMTMAVGLAAMTLPILFAAGAVMAADPAPGKARTPLIGNFAVRVVSKADLSRVLSARAAGGTPQQALAARAQTFAAGVAQLQAAAPGSEVKVSSLTGAIEVVKNDRGTLTGPAPGRPGLDIVREFLNAHPGVYGLSTAEVNALHFIGESVSRQTGIRMVRLEQRINTLPVFQSDTRFVLDREGWLIRSLGLLVPGGAAIGPLSVPKIGTDEALAIAMKSVGLDLDHSRLWIEGANVAGTEARVIPNDTAIRDQVKSELVYFPAAPGVLVLAWSQVTFTRGPADWYTLVDADTGTRWNARCGDSESRAHDRRRFPTNEVLT